MGDLLDTIYSVRVDNRGSDHPASLSTYEAANGMGMQDRMISKRESHQSAIG